MKQVMKAVMVMVALFAIGLVSGCGGSSSNNTSESDHVIPSAPTSVTSVVAANQITVTWPAVSDVTTYNLYWSTNSGVTKANGTKITNVASPYTQTGLAASTTYYYIVTAVNEAGESDASAQFSATTASSGSNPTIPSSPTAGSATAAGAANQATITWPAVSGATSYNLYWSTSPGVTKANGTKITNVTSPSTQTGLAASTTYYYIVTAVNAAGESAASAQFSATTASSGSNPTIPSVPTGVTAAGGINQTTINWSSVSGAASYNLYWSTSPGVTKTNGTRITGASSPASHTGLAASTTYYYVVTAVNAAGESTDSAQASATTAAPALACGTCHAIPPSNGKHAFHVARGYGCATCHGTGYSSTTVAATHLNGTVNLAPIGWNATNRSCSNACHGNKSW